MKRLRQLFLLIASSLILTEGAFAQVPFGTNVRTKPYSGWDSTLRGDIDTIGMGGATTAVPYNISSATANPAGFAMTTGSLLLQINKNTIHDDTIQKSGASFDSSQIGAALNPPEWGFALSYTVPKTETGDYISLNTGQVLATEIAVKKLQLSVAHDFLDDAISLGAGVGLNFGVRDLGDFSYGNAAFSLQLGALWKLPHHWIVGADFGPQFTIGPSGGADQNQLPGFNQAIITPSVAAFGIGWVPNRFFRVGVDLLYIAGTNNTAILADQNIAIGQSATAEPRAGAIYEFVDYKNLQATASAGTYFEQARVEGASSRAHGTAGIQVNPFFINTGLGVDFASNYRNVMVSIGLDLIRTGRTFNFIPPDPVPHYSNVFPEPGAISADGLPRPMTDADERKGVSPPSTEDVQQIIKDIPNKIQGKPTQPHKKKKPAPKPKPADETI